MSIIGAELGLSLDDFDEYDIFCFNKTNQIIKEVNKLTAGIGLPYEIQTKPVVGSAKVVKRSQDLHQTWNKHPVLLTNNALRNSEVIGLAPTCNNDWGKPKYDSDKLVAHQQMDIREVYGLDFNAIRQACEADKAMDDIPVDLQKHAKYKSHFWPNWTIDDEAYDEMNYTYTIIKESGLPNCIGEKIQLPTKLKLHNWEKYLKGEQYEELLDCLRFGWPLGYNGPISTHDYLDNHPSANDYPNDVDEFIKSELELGAIIGPFDRCPFEFSRVAPLMSQEKTSSSKRRIISDLKFPLESSVNAFIAKNTILGKTREHRLPTYDDVIRNIDCDINDYYVHSIDIKNAYKNFNICPYEWPLLTIRWRKRYYIEKAVPFGARNSSYSMQCIANAILDILKTMDITAWMYLDDLLILSRGHHQAQMQSAKVHQLFEDLGLPTVREKNSPPAKSIIWLGIYFDVQYFTLSVPSKKLQELITYADIITNRQYVTRKQMQSVVGRIMHISKCIIPARLFSSRLLAAMRAAQHDRIEITDSVRKDLDWFRAFAYHWNGTSIINKRNPVATIYIYTEAEYMMATDGAEFYYINIPSNDMQQWKMSVVNIALAMDTIATKYIGQVVFITTDYKAEGAYINANTRDQRVDALTRYMWFRHGLHNRDYNVQAKDHARQDYLKLARAIRDAENEAVFQQVTSSSLIHLQLPNDLIQFYMNYLSSRSTTHLTYGDGN